MATSRLGLPQPLGTDDISQGNDVISSGNTILDDAAIYKRGTFLSRPAAGSVAHGTIYYATDVNILSVQDGASWRDITTLAAPLLSQYKTIAEARVVCGHGSLGGLNVFNPGATGTADGLAPNASHMEKAALYHFEPAEHAISGLATKLRLKVQFATNGIPPMTVFTFAMRSVTSSGGASDAHLVTANPTPVPGSEFTVLPSVGQNSVLAVASSEFAPPGPGAYCFNASLSTAAQNGSYVLLWSVLQVRHVL